MATYSAVISPPAPMEIVTTRPAKPFSLGLLLVAVALGAVLKFTGPRWLQDIFNSVQLNSLHAVLALFAALFAAVILHEGGHLIAALLVNFEVVGFCLGPLRATRSYRKWALQSSGRLVTASVSAIPRHTNHWRARVLTVVLGGPISTLLTGLLAAELLLHHPPAVHINMAWQTFLGAFCQLSCFLFLLGLLPNSRSAAVRNDARLFLLLLKDTPEAQEILVYHLVTRLELDGVRPCDYPVELIRAMAETRTRPQAMLLYAHLIASWAYDRGDLVNADAWDERALALSLHCNGAAEQATLAKSACFDILIRNNPAAAAQKLSQIDINALLPQWLKHRTRALYFFTQGNVPETLAEIARAQHLFPTSLPYFDFERSLLIGLHRKALALVPPEPSIAARHQAA